MDVKALKALGIMKSCHNFNSVVTEGSLITIWVRYSIPDEYAIHALLFEQRPYDLYPNGFSVFIDALKAGLRFSLHLVIKECLGEFARRRLRLARRLSGVAEKLSGNNGSRSSLGIEPGSNDAVGSRWEFARRFAEGIGKLARNMKGDHWEKTKGLAVRMSKATGFMKVGSKLSLWSLSVVIIES
ncbi:hypothetical protein B296_00039766 [Ensete ventricosum]|uniref:Uncharacterized protein n=1 Tax=Ensete ventricosum TaxID=4639 RepID=A0A426X699_ENSVE|nr:hypothetical protein B296_00039766 [Ensete ventricosum]